MPIMGKPLCTYLGLLLAGAGTVAEMVICSETICTMDNNGVQGLLFMAIK